MHKGFSSLAVLIVGVIAVIGFFSYQQASMRPGIGVVTPSPVSISSDKIIYRNDTWKFQIELPDSWSEYKVTEHNWKSHSSDYSADLCFYFERDGIPACILQISIYTQEEWDNTQHDTLGEKNGYVFVANEYDPRCVQLDEFQCDRSKEIDAITKTFTFIE